MENESRRTHFTAQNEQQKKSNDLKTTTWNVGVQMITNGEVEESEARVARYICVKFYALFETHSVPCDHLLPTTLFFKSINCSSAFL